MPKLKRHPDWRSRLGRMIESARELEFQWGTFDCALHVANCIRAITACTDPAAGIRGTYSDAAGAAKLYGASFEQFIADQAAQLELEEVSPTFAHRGDAVFVDNDTPMGCVGIVTLDPRFAACAGEKGVVLIPIQRWKRAWHVG